MARRRKVTASQDVAATTDAAVDSLEAATDSVEEQESAPAAESHIVAEYHAELPLKQPTKWIVLEDRVVSLFGQMTNLPAGTIVTVRSYGHAGVMRIIEQGVMLEPVS